MESSKKPRKRANAPEASQQSASPVTASSVPATQSSSNSDQPRVFSYNGRLLTMLVRNGQVWCLAKQAGEALGYTDGSRLVDKINGEWDAEFITGTDRLLVTGEAAAEILRVLDAAETNPPIRGNGRGARRVLLLSRSGLDLAATLARTKDGAAFRRWLVSTVLPAFRQEQTLAIATDEQIQRAVRAEMDRQFRTPESRHAELQRLATQAAIGLSSVTGATETQVRQWAIETAKGLVCYGGSGRELGYMSTRQFKAAQALLRALPTLAMLLPKRRRRALAKAISSGKPEQLGLFSFSAATSAGDLEVTVRAELKPTIEAA